MEKILEWLSRTRFLRDLKFPPISLLLRCREKRAGVSNHVKNRVLEKFSKIFFPLNIRNHFSHHLIKISLRFHGLLTRSFRNYAGLKLQTIRSLSWSKIIFKGILDGATWILYCNFQLKLSEKCNGCKAIFVRIYFFPCSFLLREQSSEV